LSSGPSTQGASHEQLLRVIPEGQSVATIDRKQQCENIVLAAAVVVHRVKDKLARPVEDLDSGLDPGLVVIEFRHLLRPFRRRRRSSQSFDAPRCAIQRTDVVIRSPISFINSRECEIDISEASRECQNSINMSFGKRHPRDAAARRSLRGRYSCGLSPEEAAEVSGCRLGVDLSRLETAMTEVMLHGSHVSTIGGEPITACVPERMGIEGFGQPGS